MQKDNHIEKFKLPCWKIHYSYYEGTRDEAYFYAEARKENKMQKIVSEMGAIITRSP